MPLFRYWSPTARGCGVFCTVHLNPTLLLQSFIKLRKSSQILALTLINRTAARLWTSLVWHSSRLVATFLWASYAGLLGYFVSSAIDNPTTALWLAFGLALTITVLIEVGRWFIDRLRNGSGVEPSGV